jgi:DNA-binding transcriptional MerR regulator
MKVAELSSRSGTSVASIKYYLREGLLAGGAMTGRNQAEYSEEHVRRLRLIRALLDVGGLSVAAAKAVLSAVDSQATVGHDLLGIAHSQLARAGRSDRADPAWAAARAEVEAFVRRRGWHVSPASPSLDAAADAVTAFRTLDQADLLSLMEPYGDAAEAVAAKEVAAVVARQDPARMVEGTVVGTIVGEALLNAIRRMAQEDASARLLLPPDRLARDSG